MQLKVNGNKVNIIGKYNVDKVDKALTFKVPNYWFSPAYKRGKWDGSVHYLKNNTFPVGFLHRIQKLYPKSIIEGDYPIPNMWTLAEYVKKAEVYKYPREYQYEAIKIGVEKKLGIIKLATNAGKGRVIAGIASAFPNINFLMLAHRKDIIGEIKKECHKFLTTNNYEISTFQSAKNYDLSIFGGVLVDECIYPGTYILLPDGSSKTIAKIYKDKEQYVLTVDSNNDLVKGKVLRWIKNKINNRKMLKIKVKNNHGRYSTMCCTDNHEVYTIDGKVKANNLKIGDVVYYVYGNKHKQNHIKGNTNRLKKPKNISIGPKNSNWRGGRVLCGEIGSQYYYLTKSGLYHNLKLLENLSLINELQINNYIKLWYNKLPNRIREHRLIMSLNKGRLLTKNEHIHHIDNDKLNNNIHNLIIVDKKNHYKFHKTKKDKKYDNLMYETAKIIKITENKVKTNHVYNLEIEETNKYFAGDILVSNCSSVAAQTFYNVVGSCENANIRIGFSATPERSDGKDYLIEAAVGQPIAEIGQQELVKRGISVKPKIYVVPFKVSHFDGGYSDVEDMLIQSTDRNNIIVDLAKGKKQVVILFRRIEHGKLIHDLIPGSVYVDGKTQQSKRDKIKQDFIDGKTDCLISSNIFDTGVNLPNMTTLILAWSGKSPHGLIQKIGRAVRSCKGKTGVDIWCFGEMGNSYLDKHTKIRIGKLVDDGYDVEIWK